MVGINLAIAAVQFLLSCLVFFAAENNLRPMAAHALI